MCQRKPGPRCKSHLAKEVFESTEAVRRPYDDQDQNAAYQQLHNTTVQYVGRLKESELEKVASEANVSPKWIRAVHKQESAILAYHKDQAAQFEASNPDATPAQRKAFAAKLDTATGALRAKYQEQLDDKMGKGLTNGVQTARVGGLVEQQYLDSVQERHVNPDQSLTFTKPGTDVLHRVDGPAVQRVDGTREYWNNGVKHRTDGPAVVTSEGREEYWHKGKLHRKDGPAVIRDHGTQEWYKNGVKHRNEKDGPAVVYGSGWGEEYWQNGEMHRDNGPAFTIGEKGNAERRWFRHGKLHREDGPAIEHDNGDYSYYVNDEMHRDLQDGPASAFGVNTEHWVKGIRVHHPDDWDMKFDPSKAKFGPFDADGKRNYDYYN